MMDNSSLEKLCCLAAGGAKNIDLSRGGGGGGGGGGGCDPYSLIPLYYPDPFSNNPSFFFRNLFYPEYDWTCQHDAVYTGHCCR